MATEFLKHPTFRNRSYLPANITGYTNDTTHGQRFAIYYPEGNPQDYAINAGSIEWTPHLYFLNAGWVISDSSFSDATNKSVTTAQGHLWQFLKIGIPLVFVQTTPADAAFAAVTGRGFWNPPGVSGGYYESLTRHNGPKDVQLAIQHFRFFRKTYNFSGRLGVEGDSGGAIITSYSVFGPNLGRSLGAGGQYDMLTHPNWAVMTRFPAFFSVDAYDQATAGFAGLFPATAGGNVVAANLAGIAGGGATGTAFKNSYSLPGYSPMLGRRCPSTLATSGTSPITTNFFLPAVTGNPELATHTGYHAIAARQHVGRQRNGQQGVEGAYGISLFIGDYYPAWQSGHTTDYNAGEVVSFMLPGVYYVCILTHTAAVGKEPTNGTYWSGPFQQLNAQQYDGVETLLDLPGQNGLLTGTAVDFVRKHFDEENVYTLKDREPWTWTGQVETGGRWILGPYPRRRKVRITCIDLSNALDISTEPSFLQGATRLASGASVTLETSAGVFAKTAGTTSAFEVEETVN